jgi:hypothetical protein
VGLVGVPAQAWAAWALLRPTVNYSAAVTPTVATVPAIPPPGLSPVKGPLPGQGIRRPQRALALRPPGAGGDFRVTHRDVVETIDVAGTARGGEATVRSVTVRDANGTTTYASLDAVPQPSRDKARQAVERYLTRGSSRRLAR